MFITQAGEASWNASLDVSNAGTPIDVLVQGQVLNVLAHEGDEGGGWENNRKSRAAVYQYACPVGWNYIFLLVVLMRLLDLTLLSASPMAIDVTDAGVF